LCRVRLIDLADLAARGRRLVGLPWQRNSLVDRGFLCARTSASYDEIADSSRELIRGPVIREVSREHVVRVSVLLVVEGDLDVTSSGICS
jgi:hypothetical protein